MALSEDFKKLVAQKDIAAIRDYLFTTLMFDLKLRKGGVFDEALQYCFQNRIPKYEREAGKDKGLFQEDDRTPLSVLKKTEGVPPSEIEEHKLEICKMMGRNFSEEKYNAARKLAEIIYPQKIPQPPEPDSPTPAPSNFKSSEKKNLKLEKSLIVLIVLEGIVFIAAMILLMK